MEVTGGFWEAASGAPPPPPTAAAADAAADDDDDDDDAFFAAYRATRLREMAAAAALPSYGKVRALDDRIAFVDAVDAVDARVFAVVLLYEPYIPACRALLRVLPEVAALRPHTCFMTLPATTATAGFDAAGLPALVVYKGGETVEALVRVSDALGPTPTAAEVESFLLAHRYLS